MGRTERVGRALSGLFWAGALLPDDLPGAVAIAVGSLARVVGRRPRRERDVAVAKLAVPQAPPVRLEASVRAHVTWTVVLFGGGVVLGAMLTSRREGRPHASRA
jgi:hypothetical protein